MATTTTTTTTAQDRVPRGDVVAPLHFYVPPTDGSNPFNNIDPPPGIPERNFSYQTLPVTIHDIRGHETSFTLDNDAFQILQHLPPSSEEKEEGSNFTSDASITSLYYPEVTSLLLDTIPDSNKVIIFDHTIRRTTPAAPRGPVQRVHIDQTAFSAAQRVRRHASSPEEAEKLLQGRYRIVNVWRPLNKGPVESFPLAFASSQTVKDKDIVPVEHRYNDGYTGQTAGVLHGEGQKWSFLSGMTGDERILLECFDSWAGTGKDEKVKGGRVPHTAFEDPRQRADAEGRESIEVRALVFGP
ncbi:hypothetical protein QBC32DRAFT_216420 [Pseudoneurospora amorphoporcata]|uniref:7alpha-cephem-methoxylase P8 chain n=1 Tax=Pseudoneurospora amorphoporcata TaxID=241081 RepID=A0AAN6NVA4_9PEZI|nr:hypothetical protein QBC32DRAFT_216420 [Pseudoneurospora amorphoporcata]